ncbi:4709_t:CDS:2 [Ambispora gerdemannii]|uniref:General transcription and DNA repair factor IIH subunit TFB5 n=1 Tax=Ambispora gerdemannii TaxID=144530 RepID=A0A9N9A6U3_9GLOM|nr:4709_t:CDS:2 [Ambispora gerdemannii]
MVKAVKGTILKCDPAVKQVILSMNNSEHKPFIIEDLDETHLFVDTTHVERIKRRVEQLLEENTYKVEQLPS